MYSGTLLWALKGHIGFSSQSGTGLRGIVWPELQGNAEGAARSTDLQG